MSRSTILWLAIYTILGFSVAGILVGYLALDLDPMEMLDSRFPIISQIIFGFTTGLIMGYIAWWYVCLPHMKNVGGHFEKLFRKWKLSAWHVWFISFCAGVGEEWFFRGSIQPLLGVWITSVIFVAIHGYLTLDWRISSYGVLLTLMIILIGMMSDYFGLITAMTAHMMIDVVLLGKMAKSKNTPGLYNNPSTQQLTEVGYKEYAG
jgi:hypothetical protein